MIHRGDFIHMHSSTMEGLSDLRYKFNHRRRKRHCIFSNNDHTPEIIKNRRSGMQESESG